MKTKLNPFQEDIFLWVRYFDEGASARYIARLRGEDEIKNGERRIQRTLANLCEKGLIKKHRHIGSNRYQYKATRKGRNWRPL